MTTFDDVLKPFLDDLFRLYPVTATAIGDHRFDGLWSDATEAGRTERLAAMDRWQAAFEGLTGLGPDEAIDRDLLLGEIAAVQLRREELREDAWNPLEWVYLIGERTVRPARPRVRAAWRPAGVGGGPAGGPA